MHINRSIYIILFNCMHVCTIIESWNIYAANYPQRLSSPLECVCIQVYIYLYISIYIYISACVFTHIRVYEMKNEDVDTSSYQEEWWFEKKEPRGHK